MQDKTNVRFVVCICLWPRGDDDIDTLASPECDCRWRRDKCSRFLHFLCIVKLLTSANARNLTTFSSCQDFVQNVPIARV